MGTVGVSCTRIQLCLSFVEISAHSTPWEGLPGGGCGGKHPRTECRVSESVAERDSTPKEEDSREKAME
ncbi:MAG: hypothetical protein Q8P67_10165 [archaeon]|nr:hypothetical protein [archaeon]